MQKILLIGIGGFIGAVLRYSASGLVQSWSKSAAFPYGTLAVNLAGCLVIGFLSQLVESRGYFTPETRLFMFIGVLGAFTTYSTFGNESVNLLMGGRSLLSMLNIGLHIFFGLGAVWLGRVLALVIYR